jgi:hypothetical protein
VYSFCRHRHHADLIGEIQTGKAPAKCSIKNATKPMRAEWGATNNVDRMLGAVAHVSEPEGSSWLVEMANSAPIALLIMKSAFRP